MSVTVPNTTSTAHSSERSRGRSYFWAGLVVCLLGLALAVAQISLKILFVPWYTPALATLGAFLLLVSVARRRTIPRIAALLLVAAFAGLQWYLIGSLMKLPAYQGPEPGKQFPTFQASYADGRPFTDSDLHDGSRRVLVFFRGRW